MNESIPITDEELLRIPFTDTVLDDPVLRESDHQAVQRFTETREPLDPEVAARVRARSQRAVLANLKRIGYVDIQTLLRPSADDE